MIRTFRYPLRPTKAQEAELDVCLWRCRQVYNAALEQRISAYRRQRKSLSYVYQTKDLTELRRFDLDFGAVAATVLRSPLRRIDLAYAAFFRRLKAGEAKPGFPRFKNRDPTVRKTLGDRQHCCEHCGFTANRDHNAALNIDALGLSAAKELLARAA